MHSWDIYGWTIAGTLQAHVWNTAVTQLSYGWYLAGTSLPHIECNTGASRPHFCKSSEPLVHRVQSAALNTLRSQLHQSTREAVRTTYVTATHNIPTYRRDNCKPTHNVTHDAACTPTDRPTHQPTNPPANQPLNNNPIHQSTNTQQPNYKSNNSTANSYTDHTTYHPEAGNLQHLQSSIAICVPGNQTANHATT